MKPLRILYITNNHPKVWIGGCEVYSYELFRAVQSSGEAQATFLARTTAPGYSLPRRTPFRALGPQAPPEEMLWHVEDYDHQNMTSPDKGQYTVHLKRLLETQQPQVVHVQHSHGLGVDLLRQIRRTLPETPIVYTLHEFLPICFADGLMIHRRTGNLCDHASPVRCHDCFHHVSPAQFLLRERFIKSHFDLVDVFLAPSQQLLERFVEWGLPRQKMQLLDYGRLPQKRLATIEPPNPAHFGFFGQITRHKGILVLMRAMRRLHEDGHRHIHLFLSGANLEAEKEVVRREVEETLEICSSTITLRGRYTTSEIPQRMQEVAWSIVPSIWWENSPLVIQEAFMHRRPVICSDIGGMAEKVDHGVNGLHFEVGNPRALADAMLGASKDGGLWSRLVDGIPEILTMDEAVRVHLDLYRSLREKRAA